MACQALKGKVSDWFDKKDIRSAFIEKCVKNFFILFILFYARREEVEAG